MTTDRAKSQVESQGPVSSPGLVDSVLFSKQDTQQALQIVKAIRTGNTDLLTDTSAQLPSDLPNLELISSKVNDLLKGNVTFINSGSDGEALLGFQCKPSLGADPIIELTPGSNHAVAFDAGDWSGSGPPSISVKNGLSNVSQSWTGNSNQSDSSMVRSTGHGGAQSLDTADSLANGAWADTFRSVGDSFRADYDLIAAPVNGVYQEIKGFIGSEVKAAEDFAHGDILGGLGYSIGAPLIASIDGAEGVAHEIAVANKDGWHGLENSFNSLTHSARGIADNVRGDADLIAAPYLATFEGVKGTIDSQIKGLEDIAHGDVLGGIGHIVSSPVDGTVDATKEVGHQIANAGKNFWHGIENIF